jgi:hypothetical protein
MEKDREGGTPDGWSGLRAIATLSELNARCFAMLAEAARGEQVAAECGAIYRERDLWRQVDQRSCERAGRCPVLLLNLNFDSFPWWKRVCAEPVAASRPVGQLLLTREDRARELLREILMEVWRLGGALPGAANLLFGMAPGVSLEISNLSASHIDHIAASYARDLRPRWEENRVFWKNLLQAVTGTDDEALFALSLHCWQLLGSEFDLAYRAQ